MSPEYFAQIPILLMNYNSLDPGDVNLQRLDQDPFRPPLFSLHGGRLASISS